MFRTLNCQEYVSELSPFSIFSWPLSNGISHFLFITVGPVNWCCRIRRLPLVKGVRSPIKATCLPWVVTCNTWRRYFGVCAVHVSARRSGHVMCNTSLRPLQGLEWCRRVLTQSIDWSYKSLAISLLDSDLRPGQTCHSKVMRRKEVTHSNGQ